ncbi:Gfo/Idh/MocA family protein [Deinococcus roseus]|uniref:Dehydrogenase n=1 Tax=Deinococcus roseus TaxID=392414 RepID=A0ABQ2D2F1_9DEIO|nr:Gfo/Idh/MocA family oxidoreductase [Deinococcus roseus]GGJ43048.1 dehydrogenase [Deinococcus roseus]
MRVGIIGSGTMGLTHLQAWKNLGVEVVMHSQDQAHALHLAQQHGISTILTLESLFDHVDIVDICTPTETHKDLTLQAARAGKHVICEKPMALSEQDAQQMIEACAQHKVRLFIAMVVRFFPQYTAAQKMIQEGRIGQPRVLRLKRVANPPYGGSAWFANEQRSGGMLVDMMLHDIDYAIWCAGPVSRVYAQCTRAGIRQYAQAILTHTGGAISHVECGWVYPPGVFRTGLDIAGSEGLIEWSSDQLPTLRHLQAEENSSKPQVGLPAVAGADPFLLELQHAHQAIESGTEFRVTSQDALYALRVALAARESSRHHTAINLGRHP